jgi:hypothetical protein
VRPRPSNPWETGWGNSRGGWGGGGGGGGLFNWLFR